MVTGENVVDFCTVFERFACFFSLAAPQPPDNGGKTDWRAVADEREKVDWRARNELTGPGIVTIAVLSSLCCRRSIN